ncbi:melanophilin a isoform X2 [Periophthalmus magnuspinnatus]|uniref:melanophilin a isoform X2 n=1 Tax=Periophthalmus magnuspinnatus TaxID=409849 RepID=UPI002436EBF8|nr:melanophilin a isoform X2 [Periophthalmus magnuspinnatus]
MDRKLDLTRLSDEEAKHVWEVIQRDFTLRKKEEQRLGDLKTRIEKEDSKRELLGAQTGLGDSMCICCLQPFKFLLNSKRQCLDCQLYTCKSCSRYNKKEHGWVCDNCRMTRVLKMGTLGWYHDNVRNRFKRFGSAKVMRSLYKRLNGDGRDDDTQSMPDVRSHLYNGVDEEYADMDAQRLKAMRKSKRLLSVHPMDFDSEEYFSYSRRPSAQLMQEERGYMDYDVYGHRGHRRKSMDRYNMRAGACQVRGRSRVRGPASDPLLSAFSDDYGDGRMVHTRSLSKISAVARQQYVDTSDEEDQRFPAHGPYRRRNSRGSQEQAPPITELNKRMFAIENLLTRLEEKIGPDDQTEEEKLRRKLSELAGNLSDRNLSSDDETNSKRTSNNLPKTKTETRAAESKEAEADPALSSSSDEGPGNAQKKSSAAALCDLTTEVLRTINATETAMVQLGLTEASPLGNSHASNGSDHTSDQAFRELEENVYLAAGKSYDLEGKLRRLEQSAKNRFGGTTDSDLSELEDVVALTAARVQSAESEVSDIESKLAALSSGSKKKASVSQRKKSTQDFTTSRGSPWKNIY